MSKWGYNLTMNETWKAIVPIKIQTGEVFEPYGYEVSNLGRIRSYRGTKGLKAEPKIINGRPDPNDIKTITCLIRIVLE